MKIAKDGLRSKVRIGYDGRVYKTFRDHDAEKRYRNEIRVLKVLEARGCNFVPRYLDSDDDTLTLVTTNCGHPADKISEEKAAELFRELEENFRVVHDDPFRRNITYHSQMGRFCIIDFELAQVLDEDDELRVLRLRWDGLTKSGNRKKQNDDSLAAFSSENNWARELRLRGEISLAEQGVVLTVSDGMGGVAGGDYASKLCVNELRLFLPGRMGDFRNMAEPLAVLESAVEDLHEHVNRAAQAKPQFSGMGATLVTGIFFRSAVYFAHVGDSRMYLFRNGELEQLTYDHSSVGQKFRSGQINEREARNHPHRHILSQVVGGECTNLRPQLGSRSIRSGDWFVICSDGVIDGLWDKNIREFLQKAVDEGLSPTEVSKLILDEAFSVAGKDDTTLFVVQIRDLKDATG